MLKSLLTPLLLFSIHATPAFSAITHSTHPETGLKGWKFDQLNETLQTRLPMPVSFRPLYVTPAPPLPPSRVIKTPLLSH